jgi:ribosomal protein L15
MTIGRTYKRDRSIVRGKGENGDKGTKGIQIRKKEIILPVTFEGPLSRST